MTAFDLVVIGVIVLSAVFAYSRGFVREALSIASWLLAAAAAYYAFPYATPLFERFLPRGMVANVAAGIVVFVVALTILHVVAKALAGRVKHSPLSPVDRTLGLLFGLARGLVLACIGYIALAWIPPADQPRWFTESRTLPFLAAGAEKLESLFPRTPRSGTPGRTGRSVESDAERAMRAFTNPAPAPTAPVSDPPAYSPDQQRDLNRLIQQQSGP